jgi:hypothetical protein
MAKKSKYDIDAIRKKIADKKSSGAPESEFRVPRLAKDEVREYYFYILGPFQKGDAIAGGAAPEGMKEAEFSVEHGFHFLGKKRRGCPRINLGEECPSCDKGFDLLDGLPKSDENKDARSSVIKEFLSRSSWAVNIYFPPLKKNPEELRGKVKYYDANKTVNDIWMECLFRDDCGDEEDPEAFGIFYDEYDANLFKLKVTCSHQNDYKQSKFLAKSKPIAVIKDSDNEPDEDKIQDILAKRHNLLEIPAEVDLPYLNDYIAKLFDEGDASDDGFDEEEVDEEVEAKPKKKKTTKKKAKKAPEEEELEEEEEAVEEKPKKKKAKKKGPSMTAPTTSKKKAKKKPADEEEEEEEDGISGELPAEDEEEAEEAPFAEEAEEEAEEESDDEEEEEDDLESQVEDLLKDLGDDDEEY